MFLKASVYFCCTTIVNVPSLFFKEPPFVFRNVSENGVVSYSGYSMDVLREIAKRVGFSYTVSECQSGGYGLLEKGTWTGCMGNIARGVRIIFTFFLSFGFIVK